MNIKSKINVSAIILALAALVAGGALLKSPDPVEIPVRLSADHALNALENQIPFELKIATNPLPGSDYFELDVIVQFDAEGNEADYTWRAMDGENILLECDDFYDLYYLCDGPSELQVRVFTRDHSGQLSSIRQGLLVIN